MLGSFVPRNTKSRSRDRFVEITDFTGSVPCNRHGHSAVMDVRGGGRMVIFGGADQEGGFCTDLHIYNVESRAWTKMSTSGIPYGRQYHSAVLHEGGMYVFAGNSNGYYNDLHRLDLETLEWEAIDTKGSPPSPRAGHSAVVHGGAMYVFAGYDKNGLSCHDLHEFLFDTFTWRRVSTLGIIPDDTYHHRAVVHEGSMYVFGGYRSASSALLEYRFGTCTWSIVNTKGPAPSPRWAHNMAVFHDVLYVFGGRDAVANNSDLYEFHFGAQEWRKSETNGMEPRFFASAVRHDQNLYIFGGTNIFNFSFGALYRCDLVSSPCTLVDDFRSLLNDPELSDIQFLFPAKTEKAKQKSGKRKAAARRIHAHRSIITSRCRAFGAMLQSGMKESCQGVIEIPHIEYEVFYSLLEYLYTGELFAAPSELIQLLQAADLYQLEHLKSLCERKLERYVELDNAAYLLRTADHFKANSLKLYCLEFFNKHYDQLLAMESFKMLQPELLREVHNHRPPP